MLAATRKENRPAYNGWSPDSNTIECVVRFTLHTM
jgi:hypothetical protein